jgi:hypothetical protein
MPRVCGDGLTTQRIRESDDRPGTLDTKKNMLRVWLCKWGRNDQTQVDKSHLLEHERSKAIMQHILKVLMNSSLNMEQHIYT